MTPQPIQAWGCARWLASDMPWKAMATPATRHSTAATPHRPCTRCQPRWLMIRGQSWPGTIFQ